MNEATFTNSGVHSGNGGDPPSQRAAVSGTSSTDTAAPKARLKTASTGTFGKSEESEDNRNSRTGDKAALANTNRHFSLLRGESKSGPGLGPAADSSNRRPPPLVPTSAQTVLRLVPIESCSAPEVATTAAKSIVNWPRVTERDALPHASEKDGSESEDISAHSQARPLARILPHRHGADCERQIAKIEQKIFGPALAAVAVSRSDSDDKMIGEVSTNGAARSDLFPNLVFGKVQDEASDQLSRDRENGTCVMDTEFIDRIESSADVGNDTYTSGRPVTSTGGGEERESRNNCNCNDGDNWETTLRCRDGDCALSADSRHDSNLSNSSTPMTSVLIRNKPSDSANDHSPSQSSVNVSRPTVTNEVDRSANTGEDDYQDNMSRRLSSNGGMRGGGGASYRARFPSPFHYHQTNYRFRHGGSGHGLPPPSTWSWGSTPRIRSTGDDSRRDASHYALPLPSSRLQEEIKRVATQKPAGQLSVLHLY